MRLPGSHHFQKCNPETLFPDDSMIRCLWHYGSEPVDFPEIEFPEKQRLSMCPGSLVVIRRDELRLLQGRIRLFFPEGVRLPLLRVRETQFEVPGGEILAELTPRGETFAALKKGGGWFKGIDGKAIKLTTGKQIVIPDTGIPGKAMEIDSRWKFLNTDVLQSISRISPVLEDATETVSMNTEETIASETEVASEEVRVSVGSSVASFSEKITPGTASIPEVIFQSWKDAPGASGSFSGSGPIPLGITGREGQFPLGNKASGKAFDGGFPDGMSAGLEFASLTPLERKLLGMPSQSASRSVKPEIISASSPRTISSLTNRIATSEGEIMGSPTRSITLYEDQKKDVPEKKQVLPKNK